MNEITIVFVTLLVLATAYLFVYPRYSGDDVRRLAKLDVLMGLIALGIVAIPSFGKDENFTFFFFDTNWWVFTILTYAVIEIPIFIWYLKARGLGSQYSEYLRESSTVSFTTTASSKSVEKSLTDTKWNGLRTSSALRSLVISSNVFLWAGSIFLFSVGDSVWSAYSLIHILVLFVFWYLLRQAVRLVSDAPADSLDERMNQERNQNYFTAYQALAGMASLIAVIFMLYVFTQDTSETGDGFNYTISFTWPQSQAVFWFIYFYVFALPSMVTAWRDSRRVTHSDL
jgi:hypothetical protein